MNSRYRIRFEPRGSEPLRHENRYAVNLANAERIATRAVAGGPLGPERAVIEKTRDEPNRGGRVCWSFVTVYKRVES